MAWQLSLSAAVVCYSLYEVIVGYRRISKRSDNDGRDYLNELPDDIIAIILQYLPMQDVSKLKILSRRWRYLNPYGPQLNFDQGTMFGFHPGNIDPCGRYYEKLLRRFVGGVNQITKHWTGLRISSFNINFSLGKKSASDVDQWIKFGVKMGVQQLELSCGGGFAYDESKLDQMYTFSTQLLSEAFRLRYLRLFACKLKLNFNRQIHSLRVLHLESILLGQCELRHILLRCLNLEELILSECFCPEKLSIDGPFLQLKDLKLKYLKGPKVVELSAPKLTNFEYHGEQVEYTFSRVPVLVNVYFCVHFQKETYTFDDISRHAPRLQCLTFDGPICLKYRSPACPTTFKNLIKLNSNLFNGCDLHNVIDFLRICPLLQKLRVAILIPSRLQKEDNRTMALRQRSIHSQLKEVEITGFYGSETQIELVIYLLETAIALKRMAISLDKRRYCSASGPFVSFYDKRESFIKQLLGKAASKSAVVILESVPIVF